MIIVISQILLIEFHMAARVLKMAEYHIDTLSPPRGKDGILLSFSNP